MKSGYYHELNETEIITELNNKEEIYDLTVEELDRLDEIDLAIHECICTLAERQVDWNQGIIETVVSAIEDALEAKKIKVRHPGRIIEDNRSFYYKG